MDDMIVINLMRDNNSEHCNRIVKWMGYHIMTRGGGDLICCLPDTFKEYWENTIDRKARASYRKAVNNNIKIRQIFNTKEVEDDLYKIQHSTEIRQGRPLTKKYYGKKCDIVDFTKYNCPLHKEEFWVTEKDGTAVSYVWLVFCGEYLKTNSIMGYVDYWKYGIMKYMLIEILKRKIESENNIIKYFSYGTRNFLNKNLKYFCKELGLGFPERKIING